MSNKNDSISWFRANNYSNTAWKFVANIQSPNIIATKIRKNMVISKLKFIEIKATGKNTKIAMP